MVNINTKEYWDERWKNSSAVSRKAEKAVYDLVEPNTSVLDIGCGLGRILRMLRKDKHVDGIGIDISEVAIQRLRRYGIPGEVMRAETVGLITRLFDITIIVHTLEHLDDDEGCIRGMKRITTKYSVIVVPNDCIGPDEEKEHIRIYNKESLSNLVLKYYSKVEDYSVGDHLVLKCLV
jgi:2-polyprenyl-3-methyl-5-hydroxy-6-metoxy-1,4-benzoquinol methylase